MNLFKENPNVHKQEQDPVLVVPVNTVGVMGKGMAKQARQYFPESSELYRANAVNLSGGDTLYFRENTPLYGGVIFVATKEDWRRPSKIEWIDKGVRNIRQILIENPVLFAYIPPIGAGLGGLPFGHVRYIVHQGLRDVGDNYCFVEPPTRKGR